MLAVGTLLHVSGKGVVGIGVAEIALLRDLPHDVDGKGVEQGAKDFGAGWWGVVEAGREKCCREIGVAKGPLEKYVI